jgi:hypothetical protein
MMEYLHVLEALYHDCVQLFDKVMVKQLRKDYLAVVHKKKGMAHRKKVALGGKSTSSTRLVMQILKWKIMVT